MDFSAIFIAPKTDLKVWWQVCCKSNEAGVATILRCCRSNNTTSSRSSNAFTCAPTAAGVTESSSAALLKLPRRAADSKTLRLSKGGKSHIRGDSYYRGTVKPSQDNRLPWRFLLPITTGYKLNTFPGKFPYFVVILNRYNISQSCKEQ